jgi:hypothetical protein
VNIEISILAFNGDSKKQNSLLPSLGEGLGMRVEINFLGT